MRTKLRPAVAKTRRTQRRAAAEAHSAERERLAQCTPHDLAWKKWGPYLSERQWGTVREDYSANGDAWDYFPHDHARSRAYRWGEDGLAGILRPRAAAVPVAGAVERPRSDSEGAAVRPHQRRRQSRRGRQGALLLPRRDADALVPEDALQVSAARVSVRRARRGEPAPRHATSRNTSCSTRASSTTTATSTCSSSTRRRMPTTC